MCESVAWFDPADLAALFDLAGRTVCSLDESAASDGFLSCDLVRMTDAAFGDETDGGQTVSIAVG